MPEHLTVGFFDPFAFLASFSPPDPSFFLFGGMAMITQTDNKV
jgi:hypothetical protein